MPTPAVLSSSLDALFRCTGPEGALFLLLPLAGLPLTLLALGLALGRRARPALVLAGLVVGLGATAVHGARGLQALRAASVLAVPQGGDARALEGPQAMVRLLNGLRAEHAFLPLGVLAGLPLLLGGAGAGAVALARAGGRS